MSTNRIRRRLGSELQAGDIVEVWWNIDGAFVADCIDYLRPYEGILSDQLPGARIAFFVSGREMTVEANGMFNVRV